MGAFASRLSLVCFYVDLFCMRAIYEKFGRQMGYQKGINCTNMRVCSLMVTRSTLAEQERWLDTEE